MALCHKIVYKLEDKKMMIHMLKANNGDAFVIQHKDQKGEIHNLIIDGGTAGAYRGELKRMFETINREGIEAIFLTHADDDHIGGILKFFSKVEMLNVSKVYYNSAGLLAYEFGKERIKENELMLDISDVNHSYKQAISFDSLLCQKGIATNAHLIHNGLNNFKIGDIELKILSPTMEQLEVLSRRWKRESYPETDNGGTKSDHKKAIRELWDKPDCLSNTITNDSSISFLFKYEQDIILFMGDANPEIIREALVKQGYSEENKIHLSFLKLSHHGSKHNISLDLLKMMSCNKYLISTNGTRHGHPDKETLAKIIRNRSNSDPVYFYFNYEYGNIITEQEMKEYNVVCEIKRKFCL